MNARRVAIAAGVIGVVAFGALAAANIGPRPLLIYAHRGDINPTDGYPENTLPALQLAMARGADGIEFDVQLSADKTVWLMHDASVDRTTDGSGDVAHLHDAELAALTIDDGLGWRPGLGTLHPPQLIEVSDTAVPAQARHLEVDLKDYTDLLAVDVVAWLRNGGWTAKAEVNVKTAGQAAIVRAAGITVLAQPDWLPDVATDPNVDIVLVWGSELQQVLKGRPGSQVELFRNSLAEAYKPEVPLIGEARELGLRAFIADDIEAVR